MKFTLLLSLVVSFQVTASVFSQQISIKQTTKGQTVRNVLKIIEKESNTRFFYNDDYKQLNDIVTQNVSTNSLNEVLKQLLGPSGMTYKVIENNFVVVYPKEIQQKIKVTGTVSDASTGESLAGVNIIIENTTSGTMSDMDGNFTLEIENTHVALVFSYVGYNSVRVDLKGQTKINVSMTPKIKSLDEIVVVGYGQASRKQLASAVSTIDPEDLNRGAISDVRQLIQGKVPGLNITASGDPNKSPAVILRGSSTLNSSQGPFYVIDGIPGADISLVAPENIAAIDILKDAAATSIYGNRAANGVIMITTKHGKSGQMVVTYSGYVGLEKVSNQLDVMDTAQLRKFVRDNGQSFSPNDDKGVSTNWQKEIERSTAVSQSHTLSISGGTENNNYSASINYINKEGIILKSNLSRVIARLSVEQYALKHKIKFGITLSNSNSESNNTPQLNSALLQAASYLPISPVKNADGTYFENFTNTGYFNPVAMINHGKDNTKYNNLVAGFNTQVLLPFGFTYDLNISYQNYSTLHGEYYDSYYSRYNTANFYNNPDPPSTHSLMNFGTNGSALRNSYQSTSKILETFLTWNKNFGQHYFKAVLGYSWQGNVYGDGFQATSTNFPVDNIGYNNMALSNYSAISGYMVNFGASDAYQETKLISDFVRLNYSFKEKYLLQGSIRRDGSSVFGTNNHWGYFPSVGIAWRINEESFMKSLNIFNDLKLRASYGVTGNSSGFNAYTAQFVSGSLGTYYYNGVQVSAYGPTQAANPDLKWEKTTTTNLGLDFTVMKGKVSGSVEVYNKKTEGMIYSYNVDIVKVPVGSIVANGGSMSNKGIELSLNLTPVNTKDFSWTTNLNLAHNVNKIVSLANPLFVGGDSVRITQPDGGGQTGSTLQILKEGKPLGQFFSLQYAGKDTSGVSQYVDHNGKLTTSPQIGVDYRYVGSAQPKLLLGWTNTFRYRNFDLNVFIRGVFGNKIFNATRADLFRPTTAHSTNILSDASGESTKDKNAYKYSSRFIENGSYLRFDNATLGYNFKEGIPYIKALRIYMSVNNLFVITKYTGVDPEINQGGIAPGVDSNNFYPKTRTILFGFNVSF